MTPTGNLTGLLQRWNQGDADALNEFAPLVQHELRVMARRLLRGQGGRDRFESMELVQESYLRLMGWHAVQWQRNASTVHTWKISWKPKCPGHGLGRFIA